MSPNGTELEGEQPRLFDEFNDDDDEGGYGFGAAGGGKNDRAKVVLVAPTRSPAVPLAPTGESGCRGGPSTRSSAATKGESASGAAIKGGDGENTPAKYPVPVLTGGWVGENGSAVWRHWQARRDSEDERRDEEACARQASAAAAATEEGGEESLLNKGRRVSSGTEARSLCPACVSRWDRVSMRRVVSG